MDALVMPLAGIGLFLLQLVIVFGLVRLSSPSESGEDKGTISDEIGAPVN